MSYPLAVTQAFEIMIYVAVKMKNGHYEFLTTRYLSEKLGIPAPSVKKILKHLSDSGLLMTKEGVKGGILLNRSADTISLLDIFVAMQNQKPLFKRDIITLETETARQLEMRMKHALVQAEEAMKNSLKNTMLHELIEM